MSEAYVYIMPHKEHANLGFFHGVNIEEEIDNLEGSGKKLRHIKIRSLESANSKEVKAALKAAIMERRKALEGNK
jgi:hypothetical protein